MKFEVKGEDQNRVLYITLDNGITLEIRASSRCADWANMEYEVFIGDDIVFFD